MPVHSSLRIVPVHQPSWPDQAPALAPILALGLGKLRHLLLQAGLQAPAPGQDLLQPLVPVPVPVPVLGPYDALWISSWPEPREESLGVLCRVHPLPSGELLPW